MAYSRRLFLQWAAAVSTIGVPRRLIAAAPTGYRPALLPSQREVWDHQTWMAKLGPKYTGNHAHAEFVEFLATSMKALGLDVARERYTFPRWDARRWSISIEPFGASAFRPAVTSYFPYSGHTSAAGVTGDLVYAGRNPTFALDNVRGKIALVECPVNSRKFAELYQAWGVHPDGDHFPAETRPARGPIADLTQFQKAGALAVILAWTDISDANAADQYTPFSRPPQNIPGLYVGRDVGARLRALAATGAKATVVLEAETFADTLTDTIVATLPGASAEEVVILNTHTDGPNATEENGALGLLALAKYFSKIPRADRRRTLVFPMTTGHFAGPWVPSIRGFIENNPDVVKKAVAAVTVEHLGCREWLDEVAAGGEIHYRETGRMEWSVAITPSKPMAGLLVDAVQGSRDRAGVVNPVKGGFLGEGNSLSRAGIPTIGYIPQPNYLLAGPADGCIEKLSPELMHSQIEVFAKLVHKINGLTAAELKA
ncbi:MAG TPA: M28 family metallopeptidase [Vicinamibacterales bacterium]